MPLAYLFDHNVKRAVALGLREREVDVVTALEDGCHTLSDPELLTRATELGRVLFSNDDDLLREARHRQVHGIDFPGVVYAHQRLPIGRVIQELEILAEVSTPGDMLNRVLFLPT